MGISERRAREKENLRQEILDAARELFAREGYSNISMRKIAEKIEYSPTTIYLYFKDKEELLKEVCETTFAELGQNIRELSEPISDPLQALKKGLRAYIEFGLAHPYHYEVVFNSPLFMHYPDSEHYPYEGSMGQRTFEYLKSQVQSCADAVHFKKSDTDTMSQVIWAGIHGITSLLNGHLDFPWVERDKFIDTMIDTLIDGLRD